MRLAVVALGHVHAEDLAALTTKFEHIEQLVLDIPPRDDIAKHRAEFNRAVDAASTDWVLIVRERETIDEDLASEILRFASDAKARGFRIRSVPFYCGKPLKLAGDDGEVRLFHRRHYARFSNKGQWDEIAIQGTVMRLQHVLRSVTFASAEEHRAELERNAKRVSMPRRILQFIGYELGIRTLDANTLQYLWIEAAYGD